MIQLDHIHSLTEFQREAKSHIQRLKRTGKPEVLTVNGRAEIIVQDAKAYQKLLNVLDQAQAIVAVQEGLESTHKKQGQPAKKVLNRIRKKHQIPGGE
jgi:PHD/YefM family antitoxin component YafN of YafNO toxin-antitoxin module